MTARNDDAMPTLTLTPVADDVTEGTSLTWRLLLSEVADVDVSGPLVLLPVSGGAELSTADVERGCLEENFGELPEQPLSLSGIWECPTISVNVPAGQASAEVRVPTVKDAVSEPTESLRARLTTYDADWEPHEGPGFTGSVRDVP
ncbi:hypothetical protein ACFC0D_07950 [Streptomyces sp. NPDC056222]|uniref:hypothetical protein n=1 Tax=Streptomyces sp. NPDC056222 TaxID=3345749 RepID=UPI0035E345AD